MNYYNHFTINDRIVLAQLISCGYSIRKIGKVLNKAPSSISREIKRNSIGIKVKKYIPSKAQTLYSTRKQNCGRKRINDEDALAYIKECISKHWSPEQLFHRCKSIALPSISTIYRMIHRQQLGSITIERLRRKGKFKRPAEKRGKFNDGGRTIKKRPKSVYNRNEIGHWECDTVESGRLDHKRKSKYCFVTLAERKSRKYIAILVPDRTAKNVTPAVIKALKAFPKELVKTITFDRGKEFCGYEEIEKALGCKTYFCDPYCAWQKGTNENTNGLLREFYPKGMNLAEVDEKNLAINLDLLNNRPRKCINYATPNEVFYNSFT